MPGGAVVTLRGSALSYRATNAYPATTPKAADRGWVIITVRPDRCSIPERTLTMTTLELNDRDKAALAAVLRETIAADKFPLSPRVQQLRAILEPLETPPPQPQPLPWPRRIGEPSYVLTMRRGRRR